MEYQICSRCVMDTSDPNISFDENGVCNHCKRYDILYNQVKNRVESDLIQSIVETIRKDGRNHEYDCVIGVSGGVDSTYIAWLTKKMGLRPLAVHLDNGWNDELAVKNIENTLRTLDIDLITYVIDWEEFRSIQLAFLNASVPDLEIPTDHAITALLYKTAMKHRIKHVIIGSNITTEAVMPSSWSYGHHDFRYISDINRKFGTCSIKTFPHIGLYSLMALQSSGIVKPFLILDYIDYNKEEAMEVITRELGWRDYGGKHHESIYTRFYQSYLLPTKFKIDKRRAHLSALICSDQISRQEAERILTEPICSDVRIKEDKAYVQKKFGLSDEAFEQIIRSPIKAYSDYDNYNSSPVIRTLKKVYHWKTRT